MIYDLAITTPPNILAHDVVLVGGGTVALLLAVRLARKGIKTLVLECGGPGFESAAQELNEATQSGRIHDGITNARARVLGGTSNLWGGQLAKFVPNDFKAREGIADAPWPVSYDDLVPYYESVARELGLGEELHPKSPAIDSLFPSGYPQFPEVELFFTRWLSEPNFASHFRHELTSAENLTIWLHSYVKHIEFDSGQTAVSVIQVVRPDGTMLRVSGKQFVLANGTVEISRLLLASAKTDSSVPWNENPWVGAGFQDHLDIQAARIVVTDKKRFSGTFQNIIVKRRKYQPKLRLRNSAGTMNARLNVACSFTFDSSLGEHLQYFKVLVKSLLSGQAPKDFQGLLRHLRGMGSAWAPIVVHYLKHHRIYSPFERGIGVTLHCEQAPVAASRITLHPSKVDCYGVPLANLDWRIHGPNELQAITEFIHALKRDFEGSEIARVEIEPALANGQLDALDIARDAYHQCGGARMGHDLRDGVVDRDLRVFGTTNLFIAGAAVFRTSSYANPTYTALALAARLADHLSADRREAVDAR